MAMTRRKIDKVRASRDGHEFHEAWTARKALQLLLPTDGLVGIAVEGLSPRDNAVATAAAIEIADLVLYYGRRPTFSASKRIIFAQFKYSIGKNSVPLRCSDVVKTIKKFATAFCDLQIKHGVNAVASKLAFELITNRPIYYHFLAGVRGLSQGIQVSGEAKVQADQIREASGLTPTGSPASLTPQLW